MWIPSDIDQDIEQLNLNNINFLKDNGIREGLNLEYKLKTTKNLKETICAYMNIEGGWLILGVDENDEKIIDIPGIDNSFVENFRKNFSQFDPFVEWDFDECFKEIPLSNGKFIYIIKIPKTEHSIKLNGVFYIRIGAESIRLTKESDIQNLKQRKGELDTLGREIKRYLKLPKKDYSNFIGRSDIYKEIIDELRGNRFIISIDGIGGVGKSTLALELSYHIYEQRIFDSVLWFSAKKEKFIYSQITSIDPEFTNLENLLERIAYELKIQNYDRFSKENRIKIIIELLKEKTFLIILDNLETIEFTKPFIEFLAKIDGKSKVLITSRKRLGQLERIINLEEFTYEDSIKFINQEADLRSFILSEPKEELYKKLYYLTEGIPLAIKVMMGWLVNGNPISTLEKKLRDPKDSILDFCFKETYEKCLSNETKELLCIFSILPNMINDEELEACVDLEHYTLQKALNILITYSLISKEVKFGEDDGDFNFYKMLPLTQLFAMQKIEDFEQLERKTLKKFNAFSNEKKQYLVGISSLKPEEKLAGLTKNQRNAYFKAIEASEAFESGDYANALKLFREADKISDNVPEIYYLWGRIEMSLGHLRKTDELFERATLLDPKNSTYWLTWGSFHKQIKNYSKVKEILLKGIKVVPKNKLIMLKRELGIVMSYAGEYTQSLVVLKSSLIKTPKDDDFFLNTKIMSSILHTYIIESQNYVKNKKFKLSKKKLEQALHYLDDNKSIVKIEDRGLKWRIKRIYLSLANEYTRYNFQLAMKYFSDAYYKKPKTDREKDHNCIYFLRKWQFFVQFWIKQGKKNEDFIDIFSGDKIGKRFAI